MIMARSPGCGLIGCVETDVLPQRDLTFHPLPPQLLVSKRSPGERAAGYAQLSIPPQVLEEKIARYTVGGEPVARAELTHDDDFSIVARYGSEYRGFVQYYAYARNRFWLNRLHWVMWRSLFKTLGAKHRTTTRQLVKRFTAKTITKNGVAKCVQVVVEREDKPPLVTRFGGIALTPEPFAEIEDLLLDRDRLFIGRNEIVQRLLADACELCGSREEVQVHHVRKLADLQVKGREERPYYVEVMSSRRRKTLVVCKECHAAIHAGKPTRKPDIDRFGSLESRMIGNGQVRFGGGRMEKVRGTTHEPPVSRHCRCITGTRTPASDSAD